MKIYEALNLRSHLDSQINWMKSSLPETVASHNWRSERYECAVQDVDSLRKRLKQTIKKRALLNSAIQKANFNYQISSSVDEGLEGGQTLYDALVLRKETRKMVTEMISHLESAAKKQVIHKESERYVEESPLDYEKCKKELEEMQRFLLALENAINLASFEAEVEFVQR